MGLCDDCKIKIAVKGWYVTDIGGGPLKFELCQECTEKKLEGVS